MFLLQMYFKEVFKLQTADEDNVVLFNNMVFGRGNIFHLFMLTFIQSDFYIYQRGILTLILYIIVNRDKFRFIMGLKVCKWCSAFTQAGSSLCVSSERGCEVCLYCELILDRLKRHVSRHVTTISNVSPLVALCVIC